MTMSLAEYTATFSNALTAVAAAAKLAKPLIEKVKDTKLRAEFSELQSLLHGLQQDLIDLREKQTELLLENESLKKRVAQLDEWNMTTELYELREIAEGVFVYSLKAAANTGEPNHWICPRCFSNKRKSILQLEKKVWTGYFYRCPECKCEICDHSKKEKLQVSTTGNRFDSFSGY